MDLNNNSHNEIPDNNITDHVYCLDEAHKELFKTTISLEDLLHLQKQLVEQELIITGSDIDILTKNTAKLQEKWKSWTKENYKSPNNITQNHVIVSKSLQSQYSDELITLTNHFLEKTAYFVPTSMSMSSGTNKLIQDYRNIFPNAAAEPSAMISIIKHTSGYDFGTLLLTALTQAKRSLFQENNRLEIEIEQMKKRLTHISDDIEELIRIFNAEATEYYTALEDEKRHRNEHIIEYTAAKYVTIQKLERLKLKGVFWRHDASKELEKLQPQANSTTTISQQNTRNSSPNHEITEFQSTPTSWIHSLKHKIAHATRSTLKLGGITLGTALVVGGTTHALKHMPLQSPTGGPVPIPLVSTTMEKKVPIQQQEKSNVVAALSTNPFNTPLFEAVPTKPVQKQQEIVHKTPSAPTPVAQTIPTPKPSLWERVKKVATTNIIPTRKEETQKTAQHVPTQTAKEEKKKSGLFSSLKEKFTPKKEHHTPTQYKEIKGHISNYTEVLDTKTNKRTYYTYLMSTKNELQRTLEHIKHNQHVSSVLPVAYLTHADGTTTRHVGYFTGKDQGGIAEYPSHVPAQNVTLGIEINGKDFVALQSTEQMRVTQFHTK